MISGMGIRSNSMAYRRFGHGNRGETYRSFTPTQARLHRNVANKKDSHPPPPHSVLFDTSPIHMPYRLQPQRISSFRSSPLPSLSLYLLSFSCSRTECWPRASSCWPRPTVRTTPTPPLLTALRLSSALRAAWPRSLSARLRRGYLLDLPPRRQATRSRLKKELQ